MIKDIDVSRGTIAPVREKRLEAGKLTRNPQSF